MADDLTFLKTALNPFGPKSTTDATPTSSAPSTPPDSQLPPNYGTIQRSVSADDDVFVDNVADARRDSGFADADAAGAKKGKAATSSAQGFSDFANVFKAFIGTNYLSMPYGFSQAGYAAGAIGILIVATLTDHCCQLIVKCKKACVQSLIESSSSRHFGDTTSTSVTLQAQYPRAMSRLEEKAEKAISYPDVGRYACGRWAENLCSAALLLTEFGFAVNYFVFVANTVEAIVDAAKGHDEIVANLSTIATTTTTWNGTTFWTMASLATNTTSTPSMASLLTNMTSATSYVTATATMASLATNLTSASSVLTSAATIGTGPASLMTAASDATTSAMVTLATMTTTNVSDLPTPNITSPTLSPTLPSTSTPTTLLYVLLVLAQAPLQIGFSLVRDVRSLGLVSTISNFAILLGYVALLSFFFVDFREMSDAQAARWSTLPMFIAATTSNYEGIGTIIPIESSMAGNRHRYPRYLHTALLLVTLLLAFFGLTGYTRYGHEVDQVITRTVSKFSGPNEFILVQLVNAALCVGILFTYPLHIFVIVETLEPFVFGHASPFSCRRQRGRSRAASCRRNHRQMAFAISEPKDDDDDEGRQLTSPVVDDDDYDDENDDRRPLENEWKRDADDDEINDDDHSLPVEVSVSASNASSESATRSAEDRERAFSIEVPQAVPDSVPPWKRNFLRVFMVCLTAGFAMLLKNYFFYLSAFTGSIGSVLLAYILPCYFHIKLCPNDLTKAVFAKDVAIMIFGAAAGAFGLYSVMGEFFGKGD